MEQIGVQENSILRCAQMHARTRRAARSCVTDGPPSLRACRRRREREEQQKRQREMQKRDQQRSRSMQAPTNEVRTRAPRPYRLPCSRGVACCAPQRMQRLGRSSSAEQPPAAPAAPPKPTVSNAQAAHELRLRLLQGRKREDKKDEKKPDDATSVASAPATPVMEPTEAPSSAPSPSPASTPAPAEPVAMDAAEPVTPVDVKRSRSGETDGAALGDAASVVESLDSESTNADNPAKRSRPVGAADVSAGVKVEGVKAEGVKAEGEDGKAEAAAAAAPEEDFEKVLEGTNAFVSAIWSDRPIHARTLWRAAAHKKMQEPEGVIDEVQLGADGWKDRYYHLKMHINVKDPAHKAEFDRCGNRPAALPSRGATAGAVWDWVADAWLGRLIKTYAEGLAWVMQYYYSGVPSWNWFYPFHYAPMVRVLAGPRRAVGWHEPG
jgi:hypothetical protein